MLSIIFSKKIYIFINRHARSSCVIIVLNKKEMKEVSAPIRLSLLYLLYFFYERRSIEALETGTVRHRRDICSAV